MQTDLVFKAMADATRRRLLQLLVQHELSVSELVEVLRQPQSTVSRHLRVLRDADLINDRRDGTSALYSAAAAVNGRTDGLTGPLFEWISSQKLARPLAGRLDRVLAKRAAGTLSFFDEVGRQWDQMRIECFGGRFHLEALTALLPGTWVAADVGTGTGYLLPTLAAAFQRVIAVDPVKAMLKAARRVPTFVASKRRVSPGRFSALPLSDGEVDLALAILVLHHVPSVPTALAELSRAVKPSGKP